MVVSVYYADARISKPAGSSSKIMKSFSKRDDSANIMERFSDRMWQTLPPYESDPLLMLKVDNVRNEKKAMKSQWGMFSLNFGGIQTDRNMSNYVQVDR